MEYFNRVFYETIWFFIIEAFCSNDVRFVVNPTIVARNMLFEFYLVGSAFFVFVLVSIICDKLPSSIKKAVVGLFFTI